MTAVVVTNWFGVVVFLVGVPSIVIVALVVLAAAERRTR